MSKSSFSQFCFTVIHSNLNMESFVSNYNDDDCVFESFLLSKGWGGNLVPNYMTTTLEQTTTLPNKDTISLVKAKGHTVHLSL